MPKLPQRKTLRLPNYNYSTAGVYFVTICTQGRKCILSDITVGADALGGPQVRLTRIGQIVEKFILSTESIPGVHVDKYVIMPNHIHILLRIEPRAANSRPYDLSTVIGQMKRWASAQCRIALWQRSYHDHVVRGDADYREIWQYIDTNPARWAEDCYAP